MYKNIKKLPEFEAFGGVLLVIISIIAIIIANSPLSGFYNSLLNLDVAVILGPLAIEKNLIHFINDGLMAIFFLFVGLEIKREVIEGQLSSKDQLIIPLIGALGGVIMPSLIYAFFNQGEVTMRGWAIPAATDIAFAIGILSLFGKKVPLSLKVFLTALAVIDDLIAILIIAFFYSSSLSIVALSLAAIAIIILISLNIRGVNKQTIYILVGLFLWICVLKSGVHATLAGVILGLAIPLRTKNHNGKSLLKHMEHGLAPWVSYIILPIFAFANAGVSLKGINFSALYDPITLGIMLGLFIGKQVGVFSFVAILIKTGIARMPEGANWLTLYGVCILTGIGFTMSLFIGHLAFINDPFLIEEAKLGTLVGSFLSATTGYILLHFVTKKKKRNKHC